MIHIPQKIMSIIGGQDYMQNDVGMSESNVLVFPEHVLKIQGQTPETDNEKEIVSWLNGRIPVPQIPVYCVENGTAYTLMSRITGEMLCDEEFLRTPTRLIRFVAEGMKLLWSVDVSDCPCKVSRLDERLKAARRNVELGLVDMDNVEPETFGTGGFANPEELLVWLERNRPEEDIVLTHGDFCLPNVLAEHDHISGFIDLGKMGPADRWQDLAIVLRSLRHNFAGKYTDGKQRFEFEPQMLLDELGVKMDEAKNRYYMLLDELF